MRLLAIHTALAFHEAVPVTVDAFPMINPLLKLLGYPAARMYQCAAGRGRVCVHADQGVSSCHPVKEPLYGRWASGLFDRLGLAPAHASLRDRDFDGCRTCDHQASCGHCRAFVAASGVTLLGNDRVCLDVVPGRRDAALAESARAGSPITVIPPAALVRRRVEGAALVRRFADVLASGRFEELEAIVASDCDDRNPLPLQGRGRDGVCYKLAFWRAAALTLRGVVRAPLGLAGLDPAVEARARASLQTDYARDIEAYLRLTAAWSWIDLTLTLEDDLDAFRRAHLAS